MVDPYTDFEINCQAQLSILEAAATTIPTRGWSSPALHEPAVPSGRRATSARPCGGDRSQHARRRLVPPVLREDLRNLGLRLTNTYARACAPGGTTLITVPDGALDAFEGHVDFWAEDDLQAFLQPMGATSIQRIDAGRGLLAIVNPA